MKFCIAGRLDKWRAAVTLPLWPAWKFRQFGPVFSTYEAANNYLKGVKK